MTRVVSDPWTLLHDNDFTWDDVNAIAAILGHHGLVIESEAAASLDAAWAAVEAVLPDGWRITRLDLDGVGWRAIASVADLTIPWNQRFRRARGDTPEAALRALAASLVVPVP